MDRSSPHETSLRNHCCKMLLSVLIAAALLEIVCCASVQNVSGEHGAIKEVQNSSFSLRKSTDLLVTSDFVPRAHLNNSNHSSPYENDANDRPQVFNKSTMRRPLHSSTPATEIRNENISISEKKSGKPEEGSQSPFSLKSTLKQETERRKGLTKTESEDGSPRGCPGCVGSECDPLLSTNTNISGIPVIEIIAAIAVGGAWAGIIAWLVHNFKKEKKEGEDEEGYGYGPPSESEYGATEDQQEYGAPTATGYGSTGYNTNRISNRYGRSSQSLSLSRLSNWVSEAIDKVATLYENNK